MKGKKSGKNTKNQQITNFTASAVRSFRSGLLAAGSKLLGVLSKFRLFKRVETMEDKLATPELYPSEFSDYIRYVSRDEISRTRKRR